MKKINVTVILLLLTIILTACGGNNEGTISAEETTSATTTTTMTTTTTVPETTTSEAPEPTTEAPEPEPDLSGLALNPLTGLYIPEEVVNRRPVGIMLNNHKAALPQSGISQADVMYETLVEGGIVRLYGIFKDFEGDKIGPVRSARHYYLDFAFDFDALYVHYGQSEKAGEWIRDLNAPSINAHTGRNTYYDLCYQDSSRKRPHNSYTSYDRLMAGWKAVGHRQEVKEDFQPKFTFADEPYQLDGEDATKVTLDFSYYQYAWFDYDPISGTYFRNQFGGPQIDVETGQQLAYENIIVQITEMWVMPGDTEGRLDMNLVSTGTGYYINGGKSVPITWDKPSHYEPTVYYDEAGDILQMNPGKTWISVFPSYRPEGLTIE